MPPEELDASGLNSPYGIFVRCPIMGALTHQQSGRCQTLNGRLPLEQSPESPQILSKRVSDDLQHLIFRHRKNFSGKIF